MGCRVWWRRFRGGGISCGREAQFLGQELKISYVCGWVVPEPVAAMRAAAGRVRLHNGAGTAGSPFTPSSLLLEMELGPQEAPSLCR